MSIVRIALPVVKGKRRFHLDKGRAWSIVEHLLLKTLATAPATAEGLSSESNLPRRLIVEALVRLMHAGWVEFSQKADGIVFRATEAGSKVVDREELPAFPKRVVRTMNLIVDKLVGGVYRSKELALFEKHVLEERVPREQLIWIEPRKIDLRGPVCEVLATLFDEDERFVSMDIAGDRLVDRFALVTVRDNKLEGLPARAGNELRQIIQLAARQPTRKAGPTDTLIYQQPVASADVETALPPVRSAVFTSEDLLLGNDRHRDLLSAALRYCKREFIVHSTFLAMDKFERIEPLMISAIQRGAQVHILWGQDDEKSHLSQTQATVRLLRERISREGLDRSIQIHPFSTRSHAKLIVADDSRSDHYFAVIGSCNWLSTNFDSFEASVRIREPSLIADVVDQLAELSRSPDGHWTELTNHLARLSLDVRRQPVPSGARGEASLVLGPSHSAYVRMARDKATKRVFVTSHRIGGAGRPAVVIPAIAAAEARAIDAKIYYCVPAATGEGNRAAELTVEASYAGVSVRPIREPRVHAKILAWDDDFAVITSQNWLSADPSEGNVRREIGVFLRAGGVARRIVDAFEAARG